MLEAEETLLRRGTLPWAGRWCTAQRARLPTRPLRQRQRTSHESRTRRAWGRHHTWSQITSGVWLSVSGAVQYGTAPVCSPLVPYGDAHAMCQYLHHGMATCGTTATEVVMIVNWSSIHRATKRASTLEHGHGQWRCHCLPAPGGHHLNPMEGIWRVTKDTRGTGRCSAGLPR